MVSDEVSDALELQIFAPFHLTEILLYITVVQHFQAFRIEKLTEVTLVG